MAERQTVDARGAFCPGPLMELIAALKLAAIGEEVEILSSDKGSVADIPAWVAKVGHSFVGSTEHDGYWSVVVKKAK
ncbi:sulfurtransferase TusA family protein [Magnetospirillum sulfuroxidans]|uniref:Sulfurtransferase TusA family protein n=1 Tax=Magnetospirillum sulfuroxidans TaxID=611300 RepID=A0ABS5I8C4_9PROT|nr:sulfurtransferase TusA family protein [Magnetospirillum sulfuroxidans]MBR9970690.1 sulfurtransferase TusA family protein [Magnetospirillum sulfuroxidans]